MSDQEKETQQNGEDTSKQILRVHFPPDIHLAHVKILPPLPKKETTFKKMKRRMCNCCRHPNC